MSIAPQTPTIEKVEQQLDRWNESLNRLSQLKSANEKLVENQRIVTEALKQLKIKEEQNRNMFSLLNEQKTGKKTQLSELEKLQEQSQNNQNQIHDLNVQLGSEIKNLEQQLNFLQTQLDKTNKEKSTYQARIENYIKQTQILENKIQSIESSNVSPLTSIKNLENEVYRHSDVQNIWKTVTQMYLNNNSQYQIRQFIESILVKTFHPDDRSVIQRMYTFYVRQFLFDQDPTRSEINDQTEKLARVMLHLKKYKNKSVGDLMELSENEKKMFADLTKSFVPNMAMIRHD
jgi:chromosome segregation ATPase